jgi:hypothetical protein
MHGMTLADVLIEEGVSGSVQHHVKSQEQRFSGAVRRCSAYDLSPVDRPVFFSSQIHDAAGFARIAAITDSRASVGLVVGLSS